MVKSTVDVPWSEIYVFFASALSTERLDQAEADGVLFGYEWDPEHPSKRDPIPLKKNSSILLRHLRQHPRGKFLRTQVERALEELSSRQKRQFTSAHASFRTQATNYLRYFSDIRNIKKDSPKGTKLAPHVKLLIDAIDVKGLSLSLECV